MSGGRQEPIESGPSKGLAVAPAFMSINNDTTIPSPLGPVDTMPSQLGPAEDLPRRRPQQQQGTLSWYVWLGALVAAAYLLFLFLAP